MGQHIQNRSGGESNQGQSNNRGNFAKDKKAASESGLGGDPYMYQEEAEAYTRNKQTTRRKFAELMERLKEKRTLYKAFR